MRTATRQRESGVALIQVLLVTGILGLLVLQLSLTAREQVRHAQDLADRAEAELVLHSRESALAFSLLTRQWTEVPRTAVADAGSVVPVTGPDANPYAASWNFRGGPFEADGARVMIQDESGLLPVPLRPGDELLALLRVLGVEPSRARALGEELARLQGAGSAGLDPLAGGVGAAPAAAVVPEGAGSDTLARFAVGFPVQSLEELRALPSMDDALFARLRPLLTLYPVPGLNPLTAPGPVLATRLSGSQLQGVLESRAAGELDSRVLWSLTGIQADDFTVLAPGPALTIEIEVRQGGVALRRRYTVVARPYQDEAWAIWSRT